MKIQRGEVKQWIRDWMKSVKHEPKRHQRRLKQRAAATARAWLCVGGGG